MTKAQSSQESYRITQVYSSAVPIGYTTMGKMKDFEALLNWSWMQSEPLK